MQFKPGSQYAMQVAMTKRVVHVFPDDKGSTLSNLKGSIKSSGHSMDAPISFSTCSHSSVRN